MIFTSDNLVAKFGQGRFSEVLCYRNQDPSLSHEYVAVKCFDRSESASRSGRIVQEKEVLQVSARWVILKRPLL